ncbi:MAG: substrate-binding domain-containing protein [Lachnospiraceae bacterium]
MKRNIKIIACILSAVLIFCACTNASSQENKNNTPAKTNEKENQSNLDAIQPAAYGNVDGLDLEPGSYISLIGRSGSGEFWKVLESGAQQAIDDINENLGYSGDDKVKMTYSAPSTKDSVDEQVNILDEELALYPDAVAIAIVDSTACEVQFDLAAENDIPIIAFESGSEYEAIQSMISTNDTDSAKTAASKLCNAIDERGEVLIFVHDSYSAAAKERVNSFSDEIENEHPDVTLTNVYYLDQLDGIRQQVADARNAEAQSTLPEGDTEAPPVPAPEPETVLAEADDITDEEVFQYILEQNPSAKGCLTTDGDTTQTVLTAAQASARSTFQIVGFEGGTEQLESLRNGDLAGLIIANPYGIGYAAVVAAARAALGLGNEAVVDSGYMWVDQDNLDAESTKNFLY